MLSPPTGLGLEAKKTGLGLDGNGLETLRPQPRVIWPRGLVYCNVFISCSVATATVKSVIMKTKDGNVINEARSGQGREKNWETMSGHTGVTTWHYSYCVCHQVAHLLLIHFGLGLVALGLGLIALGLGLGLDLVASVSYTSGLVNIPACQ